MIITVRHRRALVAAGVVALLFSVVAPARVGASTGTHPPKVKEPAVRSDRPTLRSGRLPAGADGQTKMGFCGGDDWEPEVAAAPDGRHVYVVLAHFPGDTTCDPASGNQNRIYIQVSEDGGRTFGEPHVVAETVGGVDYPSQVDCVVTVDPVNGDVYVSFLAYGFGAAPSDVALARSTDFGRTFTAVKVNGHECLGCDHPWLTAYGGDVHVAYAQNGRHIVADSTDSGRTWERSVVLVKDAVAFPEGAVLDAHHDTWFAWGDCVHGLCNGDDAARYRVSRTRAGSTVTEFVLIARAPAGPACPYDPDCGFAYFGIQDDIAIDAAGTLYLVWQDGARPVAASPPIVQLSSCAAGHDCMNGADWTHVGRVDDKTATGCAGAACYALFPRVEGGAAGRIAVMWMDDRLGSPLDHTNGWNVWMRTSSTGGATWHGASQRVSRYDPAIPQSDHNGFRFPYGDYQGIDLAPGRRIRALTVWGEGWNYTGGPGAPGHVVFRRLSG